MRVALRAGTKQAASATAINVSEIMTKTAGSVALTPNSKPVIRRVSATAPANPMTTPVVISARVDVALAVGAAGVNLPEHDLPVADARRLLGPERLVGRSVHSVGAAREAEAEAVLCPPEGGFLAHSTPPAPAWACTSRRQRRPCGATPSLPRPPSTSRTQTRPPPTLKPCASASRTRSESLPSVPTVAESGFKGYEADNWNGLFAPAKTPNETVSELAGWFAAAMQIPEVKAKLVAQSLYPAWMCGADFAALLSKQYNEFGRIIREANIKAD